MTNRNFAGGTAILAVACCVLAGPIACDAPTEATPTVESAEADLDLTDSIYIESITTGGVGCPTRKTVSVVLAANEQSFVITYNEMKLHSPPPPPPKTCTATIRLHIPQDIRIRLATMDTHGYLYLAPGIKAQESSNYTFAGEDVGVYSSMFVGPFDDDYASKTNAPPIGSECGESVVFTIVTTLSINAMANIDGQAIFNASVPSTKKLRKVLGWDLQDC